MTQTARRRVVFMAAGVLLLGLLLGAAGAQYKEVIVTGVLVEPPDLKTNRAAVEQRIRHEVGQPLNRQTADEDLQSILEIGTFRKDKQLSYWETRPAGDENSVILVYHLTENPEVKAIDVQGNTVVPKEKIIAEVSKYIAVGHIFNEAQTREIRTAVEGVYYDMGYFGGIEPPQFDYDTGVLTVVVMEYYVADVEVRGLTKTRLKTVTRELKTVPGDLMNADTIQSDINRLRNLDIFENVTVKFEEGPEIGSQVIVFQAVEKKTGSLSVGVGYSNREGILGFAEYRERNLGGMARQLWGRIEFGSVHVYDITFFEPWLASNHTSLEVSLYDMSLLRSRSTLAVAGPGEYLGLESRTGGAVTVQHPINDKETQWVSGRYRYERIVNQDPRLVNVISPTLRQGTVGSMSVRWRNDDRDYVFDPTKGGTLELGVEQAGLIFGGQHTFTKLESEVTRFFSVGSMGTIALRGVYGTVTGNVPIFETYAVGGSESLRGYREDRFFGVNQVLGQLEFRKYLGSGDKKSDVQLVAFADVGDAYGGQWRATDGTIYRSEHRTLTPKFGYGVGVRVTTALGPIRLDFAFGEEGPRTHFGLYQTF